MRGKSTWFSPDSGWCRTMKSQPSLPSIIVVSMCVSTTIACLWMRAARASGVSAVVFFAGACALSNAAANTTSARVFPILSFLFRFPFRFFHAPAQLGKGGDLVGLLLQVEVVDLFFAQVDDLAARVVQRGLAIAFDRDGRRHSFARRLAAEDVHHAAEHAGELDVCFFVGANVGAKRGRGKRKTRERERSGDSNSVHRILHVRLKADTTVGVDVVGFGSRRFR